MLNFYEEVLCSGSFGNYGKAYQLLAPTATIQPPATSVAKLRETWNGVAKSLEAKTKESLQEEVNCSVCSKAGKGIRTSRWSQLWTLKDSDLLTYSRDNFVLCDNCSAVYCTSCFTKLSEKHSCKNCKSQLLNKPLRILLTNPSYIKTKFDLERSSEWTGISTKSYRNGLEVPGTDRTELTNVADVVATVKGLVSYETPWPSEGNKAAAEVNPFGFIFHNVAVKLGEKWYLMSAIPGDFSDQ